MCGIFGYALIGQDKKNPRVINSCKNAFAKLAILNMDRGTHGTGVAKIHSDGTVEIFKRAKPALDIVFKSEWGNVSKSSLDGRIVIGHTRQATHGSRTNENCHPFKFNNIVGVHNGVVSFGHKDLIPDNKLEVDSAQMFELFQRDSKHNHIDVLSKMIGSAATAFVYLDQPNILRLSKKMNPLDILIDRGNGVIYWSSDRRHLLSAVANILDKSRTSMVEIKDYEVLSINIDTGEIDREKHETLMVDSRYYGNECGLDDGNEYSHYSHYRNHNGNSYSRRQLGPGITVVHQQKKEEKREDIDKCLIQIGEIDKETGVVKYKTIEHTTSSSFYSEDSKKNKDDELETDPSNMDTDSDEDKDEDDSTDFEFFDQIRQEADKNEEKTVVDEDGEKSNESETVATSIVSTPIQDGYKISIDKKEGIVYFWSGIKENQEGSGEFNVASSPMVGGSSVLLSNEDANTYIQYIKEAPNNFIEKNLSLVIDFDEEETQDFLEQIKNAKSITIETCDFSDGKEEGYLCDLCQTSYKPDVSATFVSIGNEDINIFNHNGYEDDSKYIVCKICYYYMLNIYNFDIYNIDSDINESAEIVIN